MANDKKNINELVNDDDDPTAELEALVLPSTGVGSEWETTAHTAGFAQPPDISNVTNAEDSDLSPEPISRSEIIDQLRFDLELLRAKWQGLATEIQAREEHANQLNAELKKTKHALQVQGGVVQERDDKIKALSSEIEQHAEAYNESVGGDEQPQQNTKDLAMQAGKRVSDGSQIRELQARVRQVEDYADQLRHLLQMRDTASKDFDKNISSLEHRLEGADSKVAKLQEELDAAKEENGNLSSSLSTLHDTHAEEIRMIRFELGDAQETLSERELVAEQLASDLVQTRGYRDELENLLAAAEKNNSSEIKRLEKENRRLLDEGERMRRKLQAKGEAIASLLAELANNSEQSEPAADLEEAIREVDNRWTDKVDDPAPTEAERVTRVLTGEIDGQELRFPLFKDRLTIGRTRQNDIQLKSEHISRRHAVVVIEGAITRVIDWGSKNGVYVNSKRVKEHFLKNNDIVRVGAAEFRYEERPKRET